MPPAAGRSRLLFVSVIILALAWTVVVGGSWLLDVGQDARSVLALAEVDARVRLEQDILYRHWAAMHGGVYVPVTAQTPPNPYLTNVPEREITTPSGRLLTLVNPAYMTRQVHELGQQVHRHAHITSLNPIRPENAADPWETAALQRMEGGLREVSSVEQVDGQPQLRLMQVLVTEAKCLTCHAVQGYQEGDIRGGLSVALPMEPYYAVARTHRNAAVLSHSLIWALGLVGLAGGYRVVDRRVRDGEQAAARLRTIQLELEDFYEHAPDLFCTVDAATGTVLACNSALALRIGRPQSEIVGKSLVEVLHPDSAIRARSALEAFQKTGEIRNIELQLRAAAGAIIDVELSATAIRDERNEIVRGRAVFRDITEQNRMADALRRSEQRYRLLFDEGTEGIAVADFETGILLDCNKALLELVGYEKVELVGRSHTVLHAPEDKLPDSSISFSEHRTFKAGQALEATILTKAGVRKAVEIKATALELEGVKVIQGFFRDVTQRKQAELDLRESEERYRLLFNGITDAVFVHGIRDDDLPGAFLAVNDAMCRRLGYSREELLRMTVLDVDAPESKVDRKSVIRKLRQGEGVLFEQTHVARDGRRIPVEIHVQAFRLQGRPVVLSVSRDTTDRKELEAQLRQAQKIEAIGQLAGGVAHDFNNILTVILGNAAWLAEQKGLAGESQELAREITEAAGRGANLTRQLLAFSRKQVMQVRTLDLNEVLGQILKMLQRVLGEHITLQCSYAPDLPPVEGDAGMIEQVIMNLAVNARDAMPKGGQLVVTTGVRDLDAANARLHAEARPGRFVVLTLTDTGTGMSQETLARIFEPFFTTKEVGKGTGLGLATVYGIAKQHNGWVEVASEWGRGSTFTVVLPASRKAPPPEEQAPRLEDVPGGRETVLLVEDEPTVRSLISRTLSQGGYRVLEAGHGPAALRLWEAEGGQIDLLFTDIVMPEGMNGRELAEELRRRKPGLKVIFNSGYSRDVLSTGAALLPHDVYLPKPFDPVLLARTVRTCLDAR